MPQYSQPISVMNAVFENARQTADYGLEWEMWVEGFNIQGIGRKRKSTEQLQVQSAARAEN